MVRWGIPERDRTPLVVDGNLTGLRCEIVQCYVIPFIQAQANNVPFQHENARSHVPRVVRDCLTQQNVDVLPWPAVSPDLSPIEHLGWYGTTVTSSAKSAIDVIGNGSGVTYSFFPHTHFSPRKNEYILSFPPGKMSIYWDFPPEKWVYTEFSPRKT